MEIKKMIVVTLEMLALILMLGGFITGIKIITGLSLVVFMALVVIDTRMEFWDDDI